MIVPAPSDQPAAYRAITGFHQDAELQWVADLECGHGQHIRHDPPWQNRPWVLRREEREKFIGTFLPCMLCTAAFPAPAVMDRTEE